MNATLPIRAEQQGDYASMSDDEKRAALRARIAAFEAEHPRPVPVKHVPQVSTPADAAVMGLADALLKGMEP